MRKSKIVLTIAMASLLGAMSLAGEREHRIPPEIASQLSDEELQALKNAGSREEEIALLKSWGKELPERPSHGGRPKLDAATKAKVESIRSQMDAAQSEEERAALEEQLHDVIKQSRSVSNL